MRRKNLKKQHDDDARTRTNLLGGVDGDGDGDGRPVQIRIIISRLGEGEPACSRLDHRCVNGTSMFTSLEVLRSSSSYVSFRVLCPIAEAIP